MKICIVSDIHGNLEALDTVEQAIRKIKPDTVICLGDVIGYGANPDECCNRIRDLCSVTVMGNHDAVLAGLMGKEYYYPEVNQVLEWTAENLSPGNLEWIKSLPMEGKVEDLTFSHGSPLDPSVFDYVFNRFQALEVFEFTDSHLMLLGHSHLCRFFRCRDMGALEETGEQFSLNDEDRFLASVGSVGQPRDGDQRACFATYDTKTSLFSFRRLEYDWVKAGGKIIEAGLPPEFAFRLGKGL